MIAVVFDCMVFLQAVTSDRGPALACLELVERREILLNVSPAVLAEIRDVLTRPKIQARFPHLTPGRVDLFLLKIGSMSVLTDSIPDADFPIRDANDLPYLHLAIASGSEFLVSWDNDLLDLRSDPRFTSRFPNLRIVDPVDFLARIREIQRAASLEQ